MVPIQHDCHEVDTAQGGPLHLLEDPIFLTEPLTTELLDIFWRNEGHERLAVEDSMWQPGVQLLELGDVGQSDFL